MKRLLSLTMFFCLCLAVALATGDASAKGKPDKPGHGNSNGKGNGNGNGNGDNGGNSAGGSGKICLCHIPPGNPGNAHTICVGAPAVRAHLRHGDTLDECPNVCVSNEDCDADEFCRRDVCDEGAEGRCVDRPVTCPVVLDPVCGCDGVTYNNACFAGAAGVSIDHEGACGEAQLCGAPDDAFCPTGEFCKRPEGECSAEARGECADIPDTCPVAPDQVCGCDGVTYTNSCLAAAAGVTIASRGECAEVIACGGGTGVTCATGEFCKGDTGNCGDNPEGVCTIKPQSCPATIQRVCGCDGVTYDNECMADAAGVTVASTGACAETTACGGSTGVTCGTDEFCKAAVGVCGAEAEGVCTTKPVCCPPTVNAVCGCDGVTYDNDCLAAAAGATVSHVGACP